MMINTTNGAMELDTGQTASIDRALANMASDRLVIGPTMSPSWPNPTLPNAEERLKPARRIEPPPDEIPSDEA